MSETKTDQKCETLGHIFAGGQCLMCNIEERVVKAIKKALAAERATHAAEVAQLTKERDEARAIVRELDAKHDNGCEVVAVIEHDFAAGTMTTRKPDLIPEWRRQP